MEVQEFKSDKDNIVITITLVVSSLRHRIEQRLKDEESELCRLREQCDSYKSINAKKRLMPVLSEQMLKIKLLKEILE